MPSKTRPRLLTRTNASPGHDAGLECLSCLRQTLAPLQALAQGIPGSCAITLCWSHAHRGNLHEVARTLSLSPHQLKLRLINTLLGLRRLAPDKPGTASQQVQAAYCLLYSRLYPQRTAQLQHWLACNRRLAEFRHFEQLWQQLLDPQALPALQQLSSDLGHWQKLILHIHAWLTPWYLAGMIRHRA